jgi:nitrate reductase gamma subunit
VDGQIWDRLFFVALPYVSLLTFVLASVYRFRARASASSNVAATLLESDHLRRVVVPFRCGILIVVCGHLLALVVPQGILWWNSHLVRLYILEVTALAFGLLTLGGMVGLTIQRFTSPNVRIVTSVIDWTLYVTLLMQVFTGVCVAVFYPWGSAWLASILSPYVWSVVRLSPDISSVAAMPLLVKFHVAFGFVTIGLLPLSRWVYALVIPKSCSRCVTRFLRWPGRKQREMTTEG